MTFPGISSPYLVKSRASPIPSLMVRRSRTRTYDDMPGCCVRSALDASRFEELHLVVVLEARAGSVAWNGRKKIMLQKCHKRRGVLELHL